MIEPIIDKRPWGQFERFTLNEQSTVKIITVNAGEAFSLQHHKERSEYWYIISGTALVTVGAEKREAAPGSSFAIAPGVDHRLEARDEVKFLEIALGTFDESDIVRIEDKYGRA